MSENEKRLRDRARGFAAVDPGVSSAMEDDLDALLAEHRAKVAAARDAALEEAERVVAAQANVESQRGHGALADLMANLVQSIRALRSQPAQAAPADEEKESLRQEIERLREVIQGQRAGSVVVYAPNEVVPVARAREVLTWAAGLLSRQGYGIGIIRDISKRLGVPLDAEPEDSDFDRHQRGWEAVMHEAVTMDRPAAPESIGTPCDCSGTPGTHEAGDACLRDEPWSLDEHEHSSLKQCDPSCRGWRSPAARESKTFVVSPAAGEHSFPCCGGSDENPPRHTQDCEGTDPCPCDGHYSACRMCNGTGRVAKGVRYHDVTTPADPEGEQRPLWRWSNQQPQHVRLGDEDRRPDDSEEQP